MRHVFKGFELKTHIQTLGNSDLFAMPTCFEKDLLHLHVYKNVDHTLLTVLGNR